MTIPSAPYCESTDVAVFFIDYLKGATDFTSKDDALPTKPSLEVVNQSIAFVSTHVEVAFRQAGYVVPFAALDSETWPDDQTSYLKFVCAIGTTSLAGGFALSSTPKRKKEGNVFQELYAEEMAKIFDIRTGVSSLRFRAAHYLGTAAEKAVREPYAPMTDHLENYHDPMREYPLKEMVDKMLIIENAMVNRKLFWDYAYNIFGIQKGFGAAAGEVL